MSLNAASLKLMVEKGLSAHDIVEIAEAMEGSRSSVASEPANDRTARMSSEQRRARYASLIKRDDEKCCDCGCAGNTIWRRQGIYSNDFGRYTKVHPTPNLEVDHRIPLWAGGDNSLENLWLLCVACHKRKTASEASQRRMRA